MKKYLSIAVASIAGVLLLASCTDDYGINDENVYQKDTVVFDMTISGAITRADSPGEDLYNENTISRVDIFLFNENPAETDVAVLHQQARITPPTSGNSTTTKATISYGNLKEELVNGAKEYSVIAIANCSDMSSLEELPTLKVLKEFIVTNSKFRSGDKQDDFVMTSFDNPLTITLSNNANEVEGGTVKLRRVAAKIRMALNVAESITVSETETWYPDLKNMRLYIRNGVKKARLDGKISTEEDGTVLTLEDDDYFSILTQGGSNNDDYNFARQFSTATSDTDDVKNDYPYYNALPYYTYPNEWSDGVTESHQTTLTIVVPWKDKEANETTYKPTYYIVPLNNDNKIESNTYYYLRANINMMGSETPAKPMEVDMQCEIAPWGTVDDTEVSLRPLRFLIFNDDTFNIYNEQSITIHFSSTHPCEIVGFKGHFYTYNSTTSPNYGDAVERSFDSSATWNSNSNSTTIFGEDKFYYYKIDNNNNTITFSHDFFNIWQISYNNNKVSRINGPFARQSRARNSTIHKNYSKVDIELTVRHSTGQSIDAGYEETIYLTFYPQVYVTTEYVDPVGSPIESGYVLINGYHKTNTGGFGVVQDRNNNSGDSRCMTTYTVTNLDEEEKELWSIADPRTYYINNELTNNSMQSDIMDNTVRWTDGGGPYDGSQTNRHTSGLKNVGRVIWEYYVGADWFIDWSNDRWIAKDDMWTTSNHRTLSYYYPSSEFAEDANLIAPKFTVMSYDYRNGAGNQMTRENARRKCATSQQYGYPAGRWRLPTKGEVEIMNNMQNFNITGDVFGGTPYWCTQFTTNGSLNDNGQISAYQTNPDTRTAYVRCVYDNWYWEQVDADGHEGMNRIPNDGQTYTLQDGSTVTASNKELWKYFTWGDRPKENPQTRGGEGKYTVEKFLEKHKGIHPVKRNK